MLNVKQALISNKDDTHNLLEIIADIASKLEGAEELIASYKVRLDRSKKVGNITNLSSFAFGLMTASGIFCIIQGTTTNNEALSKTGWILTGVGAGGFITIEVVWNIGSSPKLKLW